MGSRSLYEVLDVPADATPDQIKAAWRSSVKRVHPDHGGTTQAMLEVQAAYEVLSDPARRVQYDRRVGVPVTGQQLGDAVVDAVANAVAEAVAKAFSEFADGFARLIAEAYSVSMLSDSDGLDEAPEEWFEHIRNASDLMCSAKTRDGWPCCGLRYAGGQYCWAHTMHGPGRASAASPAPLCAATTRAGRPCRALALANGYCFQHGVFASGSRRTPVSPVDLVGTSDRHEGVATKGDQSMSGTPLTTPTPRPMEGCGCALGSLAAVLLVVGIWWGWVWLRGEYTEGNSLDERRETVTACTDSLAFAVEEGSSSFPALTEAQETALRQVAVSLHAASTSCTKATRLPGNGGETIRKRLRAIVKSSEGLADCIDLGVFMGELDCDDELDAFGGDLDHLVDAVADRSNLLELLSDGASD